MSRKRARSTNRHRTELHQRTATFLAAGSLALFACGGDEPPPPLEPPPPVQAQPAGTPVVRTHAPLPAPGQGGIYARHGGLVKEAGGINLELAVADGKARVYLYDESGAPMTVADAAGTLTIDGKGMKLERASEGDGTVLVSAKGVPAVFTAQLEITAGGQTHSATMRWAEAGERGSATQAQTAPQPPQTAPAKQ